MEKTKIGVAIPLFAAIACLVGLFGGYTPLLLVLGYVLLAEDNAWLKKFCIKLLVILLAFSGASTVLGLIPSLMNLMTSLLSMFGVNFYLSAVDRFFNFLNNVLSLARTLLLLYLAAFSLISVGFIYKKKNL